MTYLWQRYFFRKMSIAFVVILWCLFSIYVLVDLSVNGVRFFTRGSSIGFDIALYYCLQFAMRLDLFLPLAFLLAMLKTLLDLNAHLELVALQAAGLSRKKLLLPFLWFALLLTGLNYANHEWVLPIAIKDVTAFKRSKSKKPLRRKTVQSILLEDGSELVYQTFDGSTNAFSDVLWIRSVDDVWMMHSLCFQDGPVGKEVDHLIRNPQGLLEKTDSWELHQFFDMPSTYRGVPGEIVPYEGRAISRLLQESQLPTTQQSQIKTQLHRKLALSLLPLLIIPAIAPFAMTFARQRRVFFLVAFSVFGFAVFMTLCDGLAILGENRVLPPVSTMWAPSLIAFFLVGWKFWKL